MLVRLLVLLLHVYRWTISPLLGPVCRFHPSCSRYAEGCLLTHGAWRGSILSIKRLAKCHPFHPGGHDPVPPREPMQDRELSVDSKDESTFKTVALALTSPEGLH